MLGTKTNNFMHFFVLLHDTREVPDTKYQLYKLSLLYVFATFRTKEASDVLTGSSQV